MMYGGGERQRAKRRRNMKKLLVVAAYMSSFVAACLVATADQPPDGKSPPSGRKGQQGGMKEKLGPLRFEPGRLLPPALREELHLSGDQISQLDALEKDIKEKLMKILNEEQKRQLNEIGRP